MSFHGSSEKMNERRLNKSATERLLNRTDHEYDGERTEENIVNTEHK